LNTGIIGVDKGTISNEMATFDGKKNPEMEEKVQYLYMG
jgi:hypothetical protein